MIVNPSIKRIIISLSLAFIIFATSNLAFATGEGAVFGELALNQEQLSSLETIIDEMIDKRNEIEIQIEDNLIKMGQELQKTDRYDTEVKMKASADKINKWVIEISTLYGSYLKIRVEYLLKAKNTLSYDQKAQVISNLYYFDEASLADYPEILEISFLDIPLDLSVDQIKKILKNETKTEIYYLEAKLKIEYLVLDLQEELLKDSPKSKEVDKYITKIIDIGTKYINKKVERFLFNKDVLTLHQKKALIHALMM